MNKILIALGFLFVCALPLAADGGRIRLHQQAGPFLVTLFTTPDPLVSGPADFSVAVERADAPGVLEDAEVTLILTAPDGSRQAASATHQAATTRFLQAANLQLAQSGSWQLRVMIAEGAQAAECSTSFNVEPQTVVGSGLLWQLLALPVGVLLYILHRRRKAAKRKKLAGREAAE